MIHGELGSGAEGEAARASRTSHCAVPQHNNIQEYSVIRNRAVVQAPAACPGQASSRWTSSIKARQRNEAKKAELSKPWAPEPFWSNCPPRHCLDQSRCGGGLERIVLQQEPGRGNLAKGNFWMKLARALLARVRSRSTRPPCQAPAASA